jgi:hypothetical protein
VGEGREEGAGEGNRRWKESKWDGGGGVYTWSPGIPSIWVEIVYCLSEEICPTLHNKGTISAGSSFRHVNRLSK